MQISNIDAVVGWIGTNEIQPTTIIIGNISSNPITKKSDLEQLSYLLYKYGVKHSKVNNN